jgi:hypothetical protein
MLIGHGSALERLAHNYQADPDHRKDLPASKAEVAVRLRSRHVREPEPSGLCSSNTSLRVQPFGVIATMIGVGAWAMIFGDFDVLARVLVSTAALCVGGSAASRADSPLEPPRNHEVRSPDGHCVARAEVGASRIVASRLVGGRAETLWTVPAYHRFYAVVDDCRTLVVIYEGANLLDLGDRNASTVVITFYESAREVRKITLGELYPDLAAIQRTVSHWNWYRSIGWAGGGWTVETVDGRTLTFNADSQR